MRARPIRVYLDSNVLIAYVADEEGRAGVVQSVLEDARGKKIELITSVLSITEVAFISTDQAGGDPVGSQESLDQLWVPASPINVVGNGPPAGSGKAIVPTNSRPAAVYATSAVSTRRPSHRRTRAPQHRTVAVTRRRRPPQ